MPFISSSGGQFGYGRVRPAATVPFNTTNLLLYLDAGNPASYAGTGTTWTDLSANANNATGLTGTSYSSANGGYISFNGTSGSGSLVSTKYNTTYTGKTVFIAGNITSIAAASYRAAVGSSAVNRNFNFYMYSPSAGTYALHFSSGGSGAVSSNISYVPGTWFTAAFTQQTDGTLIFYFNGQQVSQHSSIFYQYFSGTTELVGAADNYWFGPLPVVAVYSAALTPAQILGNHNAVRGRYGLA
jgi:hypothetical protein